MGWGKFFDEIHYRRVEHVDRVADGDGIAVQNSKEKICSVEIRNQETILPKKPPISLRVLHGLVTPPLPFPYTIYMFYTANILDGIVANTFLWDVCDPISQRDSPFSSGSRLL